MSLPPEKVSELKQVIDDHLRRIDIHGRIRGVLAETLRENQDGAHGPLSEADFLHALQRRGIIDDVVNSLRFTQEVPTDEETGSPSKRATQVVNKNLIHLEKINLDPSRRYLYLQVLGGKAFLEHLQEPESLPGQERSTYTLYLQFRNQRFHSKPVPATCEPDLKEGFLLDIHRDGAGDGSKMADPTDMLSMCDPAHLVLVRTDSCYETTLVSSYFLDWRIVLSGNTCLALELMGVGNESKVPAGVLNVKLELYPPITETLNIDIIIAQQSLERQRTAEKDRLFLVYAKQWWREFLEIRPSNKSRMLKIFAQDENGINRPVCSYVHVLRAGRVIENPRLASRFVSLLAQERALVVGGGGKQDQWCTLMAFLCRGKGDCEDHSTLLCSLLLGFGLDAYVCVGTKAKGRPHTWVMTQTTDGDVTFWESLTSSRYVHYPIIPDSLPLAPEPKPSSPYGTVGCVFNHRSFLANCQPSDAVAFCIFDFQNPSRWKPMSEEALKSVCSPGSPSVPFPPPLCAPVLDAASASNQMEMELRYLMSEHRKDLELTTVWDDHLSYILSSALSVYESERCTGISCGTQEFQDAVRRVVPVGHTFKGFPYHFLHRNARRIFATCLKSAFCEEIVCCRGDHVRLAVRVHVYAFPENTCGVWVMFACKYRCVL
ncbi:centrosomal protein of 76 kDa [Antennarius striatus]|uniref:centrosomal protein of 76 kDa n=1 Tax=Antennarius striatus TaxID=241820 RepID=UPI0035AE7FC8